MVGSDIDLKVNPQLSLKMIFNFLTHLLFILEHRLSHFCKSHEISKVICVRKP